MSSGRSQKRHLLCKVRSCGEGAVPAVGASVFRVWPEVSRSVALVKSCSTPLTLHPSAQWDRVCCLTVWNSGQQCRVGILSAPSAVLRRRLAFLELVGLCLLLTL